MSRIQTQGLHHITLNGADRQTAIDFWEGLLGMPLVFEQPNLDAEHINHLYFDPGDGRLLTVFTEESRERGGEVVNQVGSVHHIAFTVSFSTYTRVFERLKARGIANSGPVDRGFMHTGYFRDPCGQMIELSAWKFEPPQGSTHAEVLRLAHDFRVIRGAKTIEDADIADAIEAITSRRGLSLNAD